MITLAARLSGSLSSWTGDRRGSVSVEFVLGAIVVATMAVGGMDVYRIIDVRAALLHAAVTMADYVAPEPAPSGAFIGDLARFSYRNEIAMPSETAFVVSAVSRPEATDAVPDPPAAVQWNRKIAVGEDPLNPPTALGESCGRLGAAALQTLGMAPGDRLIVVEVCVKPLPRAFVSGGLLSGLVLPPLFYQHRIVPVRGDRMPDEPTPVEAS